MCTTLQYKTHECSHTEGLGRKETPERKASSIWTSQLCLCGIEVVPTTWAVDVFPFLFLVALIG